MRICTVLVDNNGDYGRTLGRRRRASSPQQASIGHDAFQCGYCTPAQIFPGVGLMNEAKAKMADDIRELMEPCGALAWLSKRRA